MIRVIAVKISELDEAAYQILYDRASYERKRRADRYRDPKDALRCVAAEALLRFALGTDCFQVEKTEEGKPYILERPDFHYNLSHSGSWIVIAFGDSAVGVDVEEVRENMDVAAVAKRFFLQEEQAYVLADPAESRSRFFEIWTKKESYGKYLGKGLKSGLRCNVCSPETEVVFFQSVLEGGCCLSLCAGETDVQLELLQAEKLL